MKRDDETIIAIYIDGLDHTLQELMNVSHASALKTWSPIKEGSPPVSIALEIVNAITLDSAGRPLRSKSSESSNKDVGERNTRHSANVKKRCAKCKSKWNTTEEHEDKPRYSGVSSSGAPTSGTKPTENLREKKCFKCGMKGWKPGVMCVNRKKPLNNNIQVLDISYARPPDESLYEGDRKLSEELIESIMNSGTDYSQTSINTMDVSGMGTTYGSSDSTELLYTPMVINKIPVWALVDCGATTLFVTTHFVAKHDLPRSVTQGSVIYGMGQKMAERKGQVFVTVMNGTKTVSSKAEVLHIQEGRDKVIGLDHFSKFCFEVRGVPSFPPKEDNNEIMVKQEVDMKSEDHEEVDGLTAADLSEEVKEALDRNQEISPTSYCSHPLSFLPLNPTDITSVWIRMNFVSKKDE